MEHVLTEWGPQGLRSSKKAKGRYFILVDDVDYFHRGWCAHEIEQHEHLVIVDQPLCIRHGFGWIIFIVVTDQSYGTSVNAPSGVNFIEPCKGTMGVLCAEKTGMATKSGRGPKQYFIPADTCRLSGMAVCFLPNFLQIVIGIKCKKDKQHNCSQHKQP